MTSWETAACAVDAKTAVFSCQMQNVDMVRRIHFNSASTYTDGKEKMRETKDVLQPEVDWAGAEAEPHGGR